MERTSSLSEKPANVSRCFQMVWLNLMIVVEKNIEKSSNKLYIMNSLKYFKEN